MSEFQLGMQKEEDLRERTREFALKIIRMFASLPKITEAQVLGKQLLRSGTSIGANYREAYRGRSKPERSERGTSDIDGNAARGAESAWATRESIHCQVWRLSAGNRGDGVLAGAARRGKHHGGSETGATPSGMPRVDRNLRNDPETVERKPLIS